MRCWYTRWQMSSALDRGELGSRMTRGHAATCASCRAFGDQLAALHARLSREAHAAAPPRPTVRRARSRWLVAGPLAAGAAAAIALALHPGSEPSVPDDRVSDASSPAATQRAEVVVRVRDLADRVSQAFSHTPLETELDDLVYDGKRGLDTVLATGGLGRSR